MTAGTLTPRGRHHRRDEIVLPQPPDEHEKASYAWRSLPFPATALALCAAWVVVAQVWLEVSCPVLLIFSWYTLIYLVCQLVSAPVNVAGRSFDLAAHALRVRSWQPAGYPDVDICLPICAEPMEVLRNTWAGVFELVHAYPGSAHVYVLDDGPADEAREVSASFGFTYLRRPESRQFGKAGNLNDAFGRTASPFLMVFDADVRPRPDFLAETLPYFDDPGTGIVQTPEFFRVSPRPTWAERAAGPILAVFCRTVQVPGDRFAAALCEGSGAVYRRAALTATGGFTLIPHAADAHTGLDARLNGYRLKYLPVPLAAGICPASPDAFLRRQYRSCCAATSLVWTRHLWRVPMAARGRLPYLACWSRSLMTGLHTLVLPLIPVALLAWLPGEIRLRNALLLAPALLLASAPLIGGGLSLPWRNSPFSPRNWRALRVAGRSPSVAAGWASSVAVGWALLLLLLLSLAVGWSLLLSLAAGWSLSLAAGWARVLVIWDFARGRLGSWAPARPPAGTTRRFWRGVTIWNGGLALLWVALSAWRVAQTGSARFTVVTALGVVNLMIVGRLTIPGRRSA